jgi:DNA-binding transcriptional ArsR family regulator
MDKSNRHQASAYRRYTQYNLEHTERMMRLAKHPIAMRILFFLVDQMDNYNAFICSYHALQEVLGVSESTVMRGIKLLKDGRYITVLKSGTSNVYAINDSIFWKTWGNKRQSSKFPANVLLSRSEQDDDYQQTSLYSNLSTVIHKEVRTRSLVARQKPSP